MRPNSTNEDLRSTKTEKALHTAMFSLLKKTNFRKITIKAICEEAFISRATFYAHYIDKYDLLKNWMAKVLPRCITSDNTYEQMETIINCYIHENMGVLKNIVDDAENETLAILFEFMLSTINLSVEKGNDGEASPKNIVLSHFYAGGMISYLSWQVKNNFPSAVLPMNRYLYEMIHELQAWQSK